jgi:hypothetical protein
MAIYHLESGAVGPVRENAGIDWEEKQNAKNNP